MDKDREKTIQNLQKTGRDIVYPSFIPDILIRFHNFMISNISVNYNETDGINGYGSVLHVSVVLSVYTEVCSKCHANTWYNYYIDSCRNPLFSHKWESKYEDIWHYQFSIQMYESEEDLIKMRIDLAENFTKFLVENAASNNHIAEFIKLYNKQ